MSEGNKEFLTEEKLKTLGNTVEVFFDGFYDVIKQKEEDVKIDENSYIHKSTNDMNQKIFGITFYYFNYFIRNKYKNTIDNKDGKYKFFSIETIKLWLQNKNKNRYKEETDKQTLSDFTIDKLFSIVFNDCFLNEHMIDYLNEEEHKEEKQQISDLFYTLINSLIDDKIITKEFFKDDSNKKISKFYSILVNYSPDNEKFTELTNKLLPILDEKIISCDNLGNDAQKLNNESYIVNKDCCSCSNFLLDIAINYDKIKDDKIKESFKKQFNDTISELEVKFGEDIVINMLSKAYINYDYEKTLKKQLDVWNKQSASQFKLYNNRSVNEPINKLVNDKNKKEAKKEITYKFIDTNLINDENIRKKVEQKRKEKEKRLKLFDVDDDSIKKIESDAKNAKLTTIKDEDSFKDYFSKLDKDEKMFFILQTHYNNNILYFTQDLKNKTEHLKIKKEDEIKIHTQIIEHLAKMVKVASSFNENKEKLYQIEEQQQKTEEQQQEIENLKQKNEKLEQEYKKLKQKRETLVYEVKRIEEENEKLQQEINELNQENLNIIFDCDKGDLFFDFLLFNRNFLEQKDISAKEFYENMDIVRLNNKLIADCQKYDVFERLLTYIDSHDSKTKNKIKEVFIKTLSAVPSYPTSIKKEDIAKYAKNFLKLKYKLEGYDSLKKYIVEGKFSNFIVAETIGNETVNVIFEIIDTVKKYAKENSKNAIDELMDIFRTIFGNSGSRIKKKRNRKNDCIL